MHPYLSFRITPRTPGSSSAFTFVFGGAVPGRCLERVARLLARMGWGNHDALIVANAQVFMRDVCRIPKHSWRLSVGDNLVKELPVDFP